jgi:hypothetical protein
MLVHELGAEAPLRRIVSGVPAFVEIPYKKGVFVFGLTSEDNPEQNFIIPTAYPETFDEQVQSIEVDPAVLCLRQLAGRLRGRTIALARGLEQDEYMDRRSEFLPLERELLSRYRATEDMLTQGLLFEDATVVLPPNSVFFVHQADKDMKAYVSEDSGIRAVN